MPFLKYEEAGVARFFKLPDDKSAMFGRETYCEFQLKMEADISREHFSVGPDENGGCTLVDLGSRNGTFLNGRLLGNDSAELKEGDEIRAGTQKFVFFKHLPAGASLQAKPPPPPPSTPASFGDKMREILKSKGKS